MSLKRKANRLISLAAAAFLLIASLAHGFRYIPCRLNEVSSLLKSFSVDVCRDAEDYCVLTRGERATYKAIFETREEFQRAFLRESIVALDASYEPYSTHDACSPSFLLNCPSKENSTERLAADVELSRDLPLGMRLFRVDLIDENERPIVCSQFMAKIE